jgi:hypothetical protein
MLWRKWLKDIAKVGVEGSNPFARSKFLQGNQSDKDGPSGPIFCVSRRTCGPLRRPSIALLTRPLSGCLPLERVTASDKAVRRGKLPPRQSARYSGRVCYSDEQ